MNIHLCIETASDAPIFNNFTANKQGNISHQFYRLTDGGLKSLWGDLTLLPEKTYIIFLKDGDEVSIPDTLYTVDTSVELYLLQSKEFALYPRINLSPFSLRKFYIGSYNNSNFMLRADCFKKVTPSTTFGKAWFIDVVMSLLYFKNVTAQHLDITIVSANSPSKRELGVNDDIITKIMPSKYGYQSSEIMLSHFAMNHEFFTEIICKMKELRIKTIPQFYRQLLEPEKYRQFFKVRISKSKYEKNWSNIPIIINNFNRLEYLLQLIESLEKRGVTNIHILDNNSTYPPLLEYYKKTKYKVHLLGENLGYRALWKSSVFNLFKDDYYVYTDPDLVICDSCPDNFMDYFMSLHKKYSQIWKVGFSLNINDLPDCFLRKREVQQWESQFERYELEQNVFYAAIDTTFAIYKPLLHNNNESSIRVGGEYSMKHLPWYIDTLNPSEEEKYYINSCAQKTHWSQF